MAQPGYPQGAQGKRPAIVVVALCLSWVTLVGLILSIIAKRKVKRENRQGNGMATAALIISILFTGGAIAGIAVGVSTTNLHSPSQLATQVQAFYNDHTSDLNGASASSVTCSQDSGSSNNYTCDITDSHGTNWQASVTVNNNFQGTITNLQQQ